MISASNPADLYVSVLRVGNRNRIDGRPGALTPLELLFDMTSFPAGLPVTIEIHNKAHHVVSVSLAVLAA